MYPQRELIRLNAYKVALLRDISSTRARCASDALSASQPLVLLDRFLVFWKKITPLTLFAAVLLGFILKRTSFPHLKIIGSLVRWGPITYATIQSVRSWLVRYTAP